MWADRRAKRAALCAPRWQRWREQPCEKGSGPGGAAPERWEKAEPHRAQASAQAGVAVALLHLALAVDAGEAGVAGARVAALARVHARPVPAGFVVGAVVQIWPGKRSQKQLMFTPAHSLEGCQRPGEQRAGAQLTP